MVKKRLLFCVLFFSSASSAACGRTEDAPATTNATPSSATALATKPGGSEYTTAGGLRFVDAAGWQEVPDGQRRRDSPQADGTRLTIHSNWFYRGSPDAPDTLLNLGVSDISAADRALTLEAWIDRFKQERPGDETCEIVDLSVRRRGLCAATAQYKGKDYKTLMYRWIDGGKLITVMYLFSKEPDRAAADALIETIASKAAG